MKPLQNFYPAEEYHQKYLDKNPGGYCHIPSRMFNLGKKGNDRNPGLFHGRIYQVEGRKGK